MIKYDVEKILTEDVNDEWFIEGESAVTALYGFLDSAAKNNLTARQNDHEETLKYGNGIEITTHWYGMTVTAPFKLNGNTIPKWDYTFKLEEDREGVYVIRMH